MTTLHSLMLDVRHAWRGLLRSPGLAVTAVLTLSLGVGANLTVFSVVDAAILKPLPYPNPDQLVNLFQVYSPGTPEETVVSDLTSWSWIDRWRDARHIFSGIATYGLGGTVTNDQNGAGIRTVKSVSPELLELIGLGPRLGRWFNHDDIAAGGAVVLITERFWRSRFNGDPSALGQSLDVDGRPHVIMGVMPDAFGYGIRAQGVGTVGWIPFDESAARRSPTQKSFYALMRLRPALSFAEAERAVRIADEQRPRQRAGSSEWSVKLRPLDARGSLVTARAALMVFTGAMGFLLFIACANVANLLLSRVLARQRELAVRAALGASRGRLVRHLLGEGIVLAGTGTLAALAIAYWASRAVPALLPDSLPLFEANAMAIDWRVLGYTSLLLAITTLLCTAIPAWRATRADVVTALEGSTRIAGSGRGGRRMWQGLQTAQVLFTVVLLAGAGLLANSFIRMVQAEVGYDADTLVSVSLDIPRERFADRAARVALHDQIRRQFAALPGVTGAAYGQAPPSGGPGRLFVQGREDESASSTQQLSLYGVDQDYFALAGIPILQGRGFRADEVRSSAKVAVVDEALAARWWPGESPLGKQVRFGLVPIWNTVVGVAASVKTRSFAEPGGSVQAYHPSAAGLWLIVRAANPDEIIPLARPSLKAIDPSLDIYEISRVEELYETTFATPRFYATLMAILGALALATAAVGLYGIVAQAMARRRREIGVRIALGAQLAQIRQLAVREAFAPLVTGLMAGLVVAFWLTKYLSSMLYQVATHDAVTYLSVLACLVVVAGVATLIPAQRATRLDPVRTLRDE